MDQLITNYPWINIILGGFLLLLGRRLYWLFVGAIGFVAGFNLASQALANQPTWLLLVIALAAGVIGALLALFLQRLAIGIAGFLAGGYILTSILAVAGLTVTGTAYWILYLAAGIVAGILAIVLFDWALIILSSLVGALLIAQSLAIGQTLMWLLVIVLFIIGVAFQAGMMGRRERLVRRRSR